ncbi:UDP-glucose 4-epimerase GalE [Gemella sanguinis]|uniref:UDP-glucose 4-epimerase GalE n=1 Tax=Gemella sanguinis TaxID=84135 RepID=UPI00352EB451
MNKKILVTGGAGFIGSHTCIELLNNGNEVVVVDNLYNANKKSLEVVEKVTGKKVTFYEVDIRDEKKLNEVFETEKDIFGVIHFAGLKAVGESCALPLKYYDNNVAGTTTLCRVMEKNNCKNIIFSSSATVYGDPHALPIKEDFPLSVTNPYGRTKLMLEEILGDVYTADNEWNVVLLRYFNPIGAHESGDIGEDPSGIPNNLLPYVMQVAVGKLEKVNVFGDDFDTHDGTGVRDYIHVVDLARGHVAALKKLEKGSGLTKYNLGTGVGYSVLDIIKSASAAVGHDIPYVIAPRRAGDIAACYADATKAKEELGWEAKYDVKRMCEDSWRWQSKHPNGFEE